MESYLEEKLKDKASYIEETVDEGKNAVEGEVEAAVYGNSESTVVDSTEPEPAPEDVEPPPLPPPPVAAAVEEGEESDVTDQVVKSGEQIPVNVDSTPVEESSETVAAESVDETQVVVSKEADVAVTSDVADVTSDVADVASSSVVDQSEVVTAVSVDTRDADIKSPESSENPNVVSLPQTAVQGTSWRSCCGIFDVLRRRSDS